MSTRLVAMCDDRAVHRSTGLMPIAELLNGLHAHSNARTAPSTLRRNAVRVEDPVHFSTASVSAEGDRVLDDHDRELFG